jgi:dTDP-4-dehydrorhamnose reductase
VAVGPARLARGLTRALVVGASGQIGAALCRVLDDTIGTYRSRPGPGLRRLDASDRDAFRRTLDETQAQVVFFPAAQPNVDWCEAHPAEAETANLDPLRVALAASADCGAFLVAYSSDYVFDGTRGPYGEGDPVSPISVYGRIKVRLEEETLAAGAAVVRTTVVFGFEAGEPRNFVLRLLQSLARGERVKVPTDQVGTPTYSDDVARGSGAIADARAAEIWHVAGPDRMSRLELARRTARAFGAREALIDGVPTSALGQLARRPLESGLRSDKLRERFGITMRSVDAALTDLRDIIERHD